MSFKVQGPCRVVQMAGDTSSTYYVGQLVTFVAATKAHVTGTVKPLAVPAGAADTTNFQVIAGVVVGGNVRTPTYNATFLANSFGGTITSQAHQAARDIAFNKGMYSGGETQLLLDVAVVDPTSLLEGKIYHNVYGTAPTVVIPTVADTDGWITPTTANTPGWNNVANLGTHYCRTGANAGLYRTSVNSTATAPAVTVAFPYDIPVTDTFVTMPFKQGISFIYISGPGMYINSFLTPASNYFAVIIEKLSLAEAGQETALFRFGPQHFDNARA